MSIKNVLVTIFAFASLVTPVTWMMVFSGLPTYAADEVTVSINAPAEVEPDSDFTASIDISTLQDFDAATYHIAFDTSVLRLDDVTPGKIGSTTIYVESWSEQISGYYRVMQNVTGTPGIDGAGHLAVLHFHVIGERGESSTINVIDDEIRVLGNNSALAIPATWESASVTIPLETITPSSTSSQTGNAPQTETPAPTTTLTKSIQSSDPKPKLEEIPKFVFAASGASDVINEKGVFTAETVIESRDEYLTITIPKNTAGLTKTKKQLTGISMYKMANPDNLQNDVIIVSSVHDLGPDGATFKPAITITLAYNPDELPEDVNAEQLSLAYLDTAKNKWIVLETSKVDIENNTVSAKVNHFTPFSIIAKKQTGTATFSVTGLEITPAEVNTEEPVIINASITNTGNAQGSYEAKLIINNKIAATQKVELNEGQSKVVKFTVSKDTPGDYTVSIDNLEGIFGVNEKATATVTKTETIKPAEKLELPPGKSNLPAFLISFVLVAGSIILYLRYSLKRKTD